MLLQIRWPTFRKTPFESDGREEEAKEEQGEEGMIGRWGWNAGAGRLQGARLTSNSPS